MTPDFRYHVATIAAVFLALGIGILVGTAFVGAPIVERQTSLIRRLEKNVTDLRQETAETRRTEEALRALLPGAVRGKLARQRVLVIQTGSSKDTAEHASEALRLAGANVVHVALPEAAWQQPPTADAAAALNSGKTENTSPDAATAAEEAITEEARRLAPLLAAGGGGRASDRYRERGLLTGDDLNAGEGGAFRYVVLAGGGGGSAPAKTPANLVSPDEPALLSLARARDVPLAEELATLGVTVVGVEAMGAGVSFMPVYHSAGLTTVDCIDRAAGQFALPFALKGEAARYGMKPTADRMVPPSLLEAATAAERVSDLMLPADLPPAPSPSPASLP